MSAPAFPERALPVDAKRLPTRTLPRHGAWWQKALLLCAGWQLSCGAVEFWTQTTDVDFATGTRVGLEVAGTAAAARLALAPAAFAWQRQVTVTNSTASALADFPVRIALSAATFDFSRAAADGADLRFLDRDGTTPLAFWIESWDPVAASAVVWVKLPALAAGESRPLSLYYGSAAAGAVGMGAETFLRFDDFDTLSAWSQSGSTVTLNQGVVSLDSGSNPSIVTTLTVAAPFTVEVKYQHPSAFRNRLYLTRPGAGSPTGYDYGIFESLFWNGSSGITLTPNTWYIVRWENSPTNYTWRILTTGGAEVFARSHGSALAGLNTLNVSGTERADSDMKLDWMRVRPYASADPAAVVGAEGSAVGPELLPARGSFVSATHNCGMYARATLDWDAETPAGTAVRFQVRTASSATGLAAAAWRGPSGPDDWYTTPGTAIGTTGAPVRWLQYKVMLSTSVNGVSPRLNSVTVSYVPDDVTVTATTTWPEDDYVLGNLTVTNGATLSVAGGSTLTAAGALTINGNSTLRLQGKNCGGQVGGQWQGTGVTVRAGSVVVAAGSLLSADGQGYSEGQGPGGSGSAYSGGSHGGLGIGGGPVYGSSEQPTTPGSAAMGEGAAETWGGGAIRLEVSGALQLDGEISADGANHRTWWSEAIGGGAGGSIWVTAGSLAGAGLFTAHGDINGGGGRIAVYYDRDAGFSGFTTSGANGAGSAQAGTCAFFETGAGGPRVRVYQRFTWPPDSDLHLGALALADAALVEVGGGSRIEVGGPVLVSGASKLLFQGKNTTGKVGGVWAGVGVELRATDLTVESGSVLSADGQGYVKTQGPGGTGDYYSGGGHGGRGAGGSAGAAYGSADQPAEPGSAAGAEGASTTCGGGVIRLDLSGTLTLAGEITADATHSQDWWSHAVGGAAGGAIWVTTGVLVGSGPFTAHGDINGGGGRIAVYYHEGSGYQGFLTSGANGAGSAQAGTCAFFDTGLANSHLRVYQRFAWAQDARPHYGAVTLDDGATAELGGGAVLAVDGDVVITGTSVLQVLSRDYEALVNGVWAGVGGRVRARNLRLDAGSTITADEQGYPKGRGSGTWGDVYGGAAGYGGRGKNSSGATYGSAVAPIDLGSGGAAEGSSTSRGGGAIWLDVQDTLTLDGEVTADGVIRQAWWTNALNGASGGSVFITTGTLEGSGLVTADGSVGGAGGGRIAVHTWAAQGMAADHFHCLGREGGQNGTVYFGTTPFFGWPPNADTILHGTETLEWWLWGVDTIGATVDVMMIGPAGTLTLGTGMSLAELVTVDTARVADGLYELRTTFRGPSGRLLGEATRQVLVANAVAWHRGVIGTAETWAAGTVHGIDGNLWIGSGGQVTVEPGAVVKAAPGVLITVDAGGRLSALGSAAAAVVFTALADDSVGGDTNADAALTKPFPGYWNGLISNGTGVLQTNDRTDLRYARVRHGGTLSEDQTWPGRQVHHLTGDVVIPAGRRLELEAGAVVKVALGKSIWVQSGGTLIARGNLAQPIVITSERDDTVGGDSTGDGSTTQPAPGDWYRIHIDGGQADFDHVQIRYGAGSDSTQAGLIRSSGSAQVTITNSVLSGAQYTGVLAWGGTVTVGSSVVADCDRGISAHPGSPVAIGNCTLDGNRIGLLVHGGSLTAVNTIVSNSWSSGVQFDFGSAPVLRYCDVWSTPSAEYVAYRGTADLSGSAGNISRNPLYKDLSKNDLRLNYCSPCIDAGEGGAAPPTDLAGAPRYNDPRSADTGVPMPGGDATAPVPDLGAYEFVETAVSDIDLIVTEVVGPSEVTAGDLVTLQWTVRNLGTGNALGPWHDGVGLVRAADPGGPAVAAGEVLVGSGLTLGPGESCLATGTVRVPGCTAGAYRWQVTTNRREEVFEGTNRANNAAVSAARVALSLPRLTVGADPLAGVFTGVGESYWFAVTPEPGQDLLLNLDLADPGSAAELYIGAGYVPSPQHFDSRQIEWNSPHVTALALGTSSQTYYVLVRSTALSGSSSAFTLGARALEFGLSSCSPAVVGNSGPVTLGLRGGELSAGTTCQLVAASGWVCDASKVLVVDPSQVYATFDLAGASPGRYSVRVSAAGRVASLAGAVTVNAAGPGRFQVNVIMPSVARVGRVFRAYVEYANVGYADLVAPILYVKSPGGALFSRDLAAAPAVTEDEFLAAGTPGPAGILSPGQRVSVPLLVQAVRGITQLEVSYIDATSDTPMAWAYLEDRLESLHGADPQFAGVLAAMKTTIGSTWGDYDRLLAANASLLPAAMGSPSDLNCLLGLQYRRELAALGASICGTVDAAALGRPAAGLRLGARPSAGSASPCVGYILNDGSFILPQLSAGTYAVEVQGASVVSTTPATLAVAAGTPLTGVTVTVAPQNLVSGTVRDAAGEPVPAGALVTVLAAADVVGAGVTDASGHYEVAGLAPGTYSFVVLPDGQAQTTRDDVVVTAGSTRVDLVVQPQATLRGLVILPDGTPPAKLFVFATPSGGAPPAALFSAAGADDGSFALTGLPGGTYDLSFSDLAAGVHSASRAGVAVGAGGQVDLGTVSLEAVAGPGAPGAASGGAKGLTAAGTNDDPVYDPGSAEPLYPAWNGHVLAAQTYLRTFWLPAAYEFWGIEVSMLWNEYLSSTSASPAPRLSYGADSQVVEGATTVFGSGFRSFDMKDGKENAAVQEIRAAVLAGVKTMFEDRRLTCDEILENNGSKALALTVGNFPGLEHTLGLVRMNYLNLSGYPWLNTHDEIDIVGDQVIYTGAYNIPSNLAGGVGKAQPYLIPGSGSGQQYDDNRHWSGVVRVTVAGKGKVTIHYDVDWIANDTIDFEPGDLGVGIQKKFTVPMSFLETVGRAFDVPIHVQYKDERFTPQTITVPEPEAPHCEDHHRPPKPQKPGGGGGTPSNEATDPNELVGPAGFGPQRFVQAEQAIPYTIHFENLATASAPAQQVVVTDVLDAALDGSSLQLAQIGFNDALVDVPAGLRGYTTEAYVGSDPNPVRVSITFDPATGLLTWDLMSIDPQKGLLVADPTVGFLPPNAADARGEGFVVFTVKPRSGLPTGTVVRNQASIVFDVNAPILTNLAENTIDAGVPVGRVEALPAVSPYPDFSVRWSGEDDAGGSGIASYDVFVAVDGGPFALWRERCAAAGAVYAGARGHSYAFYAVARDGVGHTEVQPEPILVEAQTRVPLLTTDTDGDGLPDWFEALIINADPGDAIVGFADVQPWGDFDDDGASNRQEYQAETDPADPLSVPAALAANGEFLAWSSPAEVALGRGLWDLTGSYRLTVAGNPLLLHLLHDPTGRLSGSATYTVGKAMELTMPVKGSVKGSGGSVTMKGSLAGSAAAEALTVSLALNLAVDIPDRQLRGRLAGSVTAAGTTSPVNEDIALPIPAPMDGTWTLRFQLAQTGRTVAGSARLTLANGAEYVFAVQGRASGASAVLALTADPGDPAGQAIRVTTTITPQQGGWARLDRFLGRAYGHTLGW